MEFKKLSEIEVGAVTENTHVIAEVDGELKRVPKTEVGGAGGGGLLIKLNESNLIMDPESESFTYTGNYDEIVDCLNNGGSVVVDLLYILELMGEDAEAAIYMMPLMMFAVQKGMGAMMSLMDFEIMCTNGSYH